MNTHDIGADEARRLLALDRASRRPPKQLDREWVLAEIRRLEEVIREDNRQKGYTS